MKFTEREMTQHNHVVCYYLNEHTWQFRKKKNKMETHKELLGAAGRKVVSKTSPPHQKGDSICLMQFIPPPVFMSLNVTIMNNAHLKVSLCQVTITTLRQQHSFLSPCLSLFLLNVLILKPLQHSTRQNPVRWQNRWNPESARIQVA